ncbi:hypothetical protein [Streptomyces sp. NPDC001851]|uniref:hypothetical protein n=1 Tax=Streptomyces sp. NPDC001851 TaxID=3154529 RepID=UPI003318E7A9
MAHDEESRLATEAVARLRAVGYQVDCDPAFDTDRRPAQYEPLGASVAPLADRIRQATTTEEVAEILTELTAPCDGILNAIAKSWLLQPSSTTLLTHRLPRTPRDGCAISPTSASPSSAPTWCTPTMPSPTGTPRTPTASRAPKRVPADGRERSAVCACPPPPRALPVPPPVAAGPRR